jgi:predicted nucleic acid-binding protein
MATVAIDTDVVSYLFKMDTRALLYQRHLAGHHWLISFMTVAELDLWARQYHWGTARKRQMDIHLRRFAMYPFDRALCLRWAEVTDSARRNGQPIQTADAWIAASALQAGVPLVTHNPTDYAGVSGLTVLSEASP